MSYFALCVNRGLTYLMPSAHNGRMDTIVTTTAARAIAAEAMLIARLADGAERQALMEIARALRDPARVARLLSTEAEEPRHAVSIPQ